MGTPTNALTQYHGNSVEISIHSECTLLTQRGLFQCVHLIEYIPGPRTCLYSCRAGILPTVPLVLAPGTVSCYPRDPTSLSFLSSVILSSVCFQMISEPDAAQFFFSHGPSCPCGKLDLTRSGPDSAIGDRRGSCGQNLAFSPLVSLYLAC